jgi:hypothetical protein
MGPTAGCPHGSGVVLQRSRPLPLLCRRRCRLRSLKLAAIDGTTVEEGMPPAATEIRKKEMLITFHITE